MKQRFFEIAKKLSKSSTHPDHQLGAVITKGNEIISLGFNKLKTHPKSNNKYKTLHAELDAIIHAEKAEHLYGCSIYIYRETKYGRPANSKPCPYCQELLKRVFIQDVYYSDDGTFKYLKLI